MKKIVRLTESDLERLVKRIIKEDILNVIAKNGNIVINNQVWELWSGWVKIEVLKLTPLSNGDMVMNYDTSLTKPNTAVVPKNKIQEIEKNLHKSRMEFEVETTDDNGNKTKRTLLLMKK